MFNEMSGMVQRAVTGEIDQTSISEAASDHVENMDHDELKGQLQQAADNASSSGNTGIAEMITTVVSQHGSNPEALKEQAVSLITNNPQILQHLTPSFAQGILGRFQS